MEEGVLLPEGKDIMLQQSQIYYRIIEKTKIKQKNK